MHFDLSTLPRRDRYKLLSGCIVPRPIALVTTLSPGGAPNAAPYSFFNVLSFGPDIVVLGIGDHDDGSQKDTLLNIRRNKQYVINLVSHAMREKMNICGIDFRDHTDEIALSGLSPVYDFMGDVPRIAESPASLGCILLQELRYDTHSIVLGEVKSMWIRDDVVNERNHIDQRRLSLIGRLSGSGYACNWEQFEMPMLKQADWVRMQAEKAAGDD